MNFDKIKQQICISSYLKSIGCKPQFENNFTARFIAPYRADSNPSLSINKNTNLWYDHGLGRGGNIIQLVSLINNSCSDYESAKILSEQKDSFSFHCNPTIANVPQSIKIISTLPISNKWLIKYLHSRKIPIEIANQYCKEIYYENRGKQYYAIGFTNKSGGYELRNRYFKGCTNKDVTILESAKSPNPCLVFEGFFDFLSYLTLKGIKSINQNVVVLNSLSNINKAIPILKKNNLVIGYLDNDPSGKNGIAKLIANGINIEDRSHKYRPYKDLNDYLISLSGAENKVNRRLVRR